MFTATSRIGDVERSKVRTTYCHDHEDGDEFARELCSQAEWPYVVPSSEGDERDNTDETSDV